MCTEYLGHAYKMNGAVNNAIAWQLFFRFTGTYLSVNKHAKRQQRQRPLGPLSAAVLVDKSWDCRVLSP